MQQQTTDVETGANQQTIMRANTIQTMVFAILGLVSLWPYNFLLQSLGYFCVYLGTGFASHSHVVYGIAANLAQVLSLCFLSKTNFGTRITVSCMMISIVSLVYSCITLHNDIAHLPAIGLGLAFLLGFFNSMIQSAGSQLAGRYSDCITWLFLGQSLSGLFPWPITVGLNFLFRGIGLSPERLGDQLTSSMDKATACTSMVIGGLVPLLFLILFWLAFDNPNAQYTASNKTKSHRTSMWITFKSIHGIAILCGSTFLISFIMYPRELMKWQPSTFANIYPNGEYFYASLLVYIAIVFDVLGMYVPSNFRIEFSSKWMRAIGYMRILFVPLFALCSLEVPIVSSDPMEMILVMFMSFSGAFVLAWALKCAQHMVPEIEGETVGIIMSFLLTSGMSIGAAIGSVIDLLFNCARTNM